MPPPLPLPRLRICCSAESRCRPGSCTLEASPMTPQPPSASACEGRIEVTPSRERREAITASTNCSRFMMVLFLIAHCLSACAVGEVTCKHRYRPAIAEYVHATSQFLHASQPQMA